MKFIPQSHSNEMQASLPPMIIAAHISFPSAISQPRILSPRNHEDKGSHPYRAVSSNHLSACRVRDPSARCSFSLQASSSSSSSSSYASWNKQPFSSFANSRNYRDRTTLCVIVATRVTPPSLSLSLFPLFSSPRHVADTLLTGAPKRHTIDRGYALPSLTGADLSEVKGRLNVENRFAIRVYERGNNPSLFRGILSECRDENSKFRCKRWNVLLPPRKI